MLEYLDNFTLDEIKEKVVITPEGFSYDNSYYGVEDILLDKYGENAPKYMYLAYEAACKLGYKEKFMKQLTDKTNQTILNNSIAESYDTPQFYTWGYIVNGNITEVPMKCSFKSKNYCGYEFCDGKQFVFRIKQ